MEIREIREDELNELLDLYSHLHSSDEPLPKTDIVNAIWHEIQTNPNIQYVGLFVDGRLISSCTICIIPNLTRGFWCKIETSLICTILLLRSICRNIPENKILLSNVSLPTLYLWTAPLLLSYFFQRK